MRKEGFYVCKQCKDCAFYKERQVGVDVCVYFQVPIELSPEVNFCTNYEEFEKKIVEQRNRECPYHIDGKESLEVLRQYVKNNRR